MLYMGIWSEYGELSDAFKLHNYKELPLDFKNIREELGDLLFYIFAYVIVTSSTQSLMNNIEFLDDPIRKKDADKTTIILMIDLNIQLNKLITMQKSTPVVLTKILRYIKLLALTNHTSIPAIVEHNEDKLLGIKGRYSEGHFSIKQAIGRKDKK